jgi:hypothetical protein
MWYSPSHGLIKTPRAISKDGVDYPPQIFRKFSKSELANLGFHPARLSVADHRYYNTSGEQYDFDAATNEWVISYGSNPKDVDDLKKSMKAKVKGIASATLSHSDWLSIREHDGGTAMSADWKTYRADVRAMSNTKEAEIDALADLDAVKLYNSTPGTPDENGSVPMIDNVTAGWPNDPDFVEVI